MDKDAKITAEQLGRWYSFGANSLIASYRKSVYPTPKWEKLVFRIASIPEAATLLLLGLGGLTLVCRRRVR